MRPSNFISSLLFLAATSTAWPWPVGSDPLKEPAKWDIAPLAKRAQQSSFDLSFSASAQGNTATTASSSAASKTTKKNGAKSSQTQSGKNGKSTQTQTGKTTGKQTGKSTDSGKKTTKKATYQTTKTYDAELPAGGVSMITPNAIAGAQYYKIQDFVTFAWNYTSLKATPTAVDILASCSTNSATYTIAMNQSVSAHSQAVTWDTGKYQASATIPLLVATYTLIIYDADSSISDLPRAGYLGVYDQFTFGMYTPQPYTPIADYVCATCNSAVSSMERQTLSFMFGMVVVTVLSSVWFAGVTGIW